MERAIASSDLVDALSSHGGVDALARALGDGRRSVVRGGGGAFSAVLGWALAQRLSRLVVLVVAHADDVETYRDTLLSLGGNACGFPAMEALPGESEGTIELLRERLGAQRWVADLGDGSAGVLVASIHALMQEVCDPRAMDGVVRTIERGGAGGGYSPASLLDWLDSAGYRRVDAIEEAGEVALRGGIMDVFCAGASSPIRLDFFGDEIESIHEIDIETMGSDRSLERVDLIACEEGVLGAPGAGSLVDSLTTSAVVLLDEPSEIVSRDGGITSGRWMGTACRARRGCSRRSRQGSRHAQSTGDSRPMRRRAMSRSIWTRMRSPSCPATWSRASRRWSSCASRASG